MIPEEVSAWLDEQGYGAIASRQSVGGGCINNGMRLHTTSDERFFLKLNNAAPADMFALEVEGLDTLRVPDGPRIPQTFLHGRDFLLMEDLKPATRKRDYFTTLGHKLAAMHAHTNPQFGFPHDNYIGATVQINTWAEDGYVFFAEQRLGFQAELAQQCGYLGGQDVAAVKAIGARLPELVPKQPASLLHGDLWGGNAISDEHGEPALIDPAAHYGWAEAELAFTSMFGGFTGEFYDAYLEVRPLDAGWRERFPLYNLYHYLNHLNLFGTSYLGQVKSIIRKYA
ncbi:MAG: fructosamine kinase family protein [Anaerolineales bacterium]|nr:fructosamine kinase family protein [Anaerolineales bacterium]